MTQARKRILTPTKPTPAKQRKPMVQPAPDESAATDKPNVDDPLSEPTRHRRLWAAYLAAGLTRRQFAQLLDTNYHTVCRWDMGAAVMSLEMLERASKVVGYSMDELCFGRGDAPEAPPPAPQPVQQIPPVRQREPEVPLSDAKVRALMDKHDVPAATRAAFGTHAVSPEGRYQTFTASYVEAWCAAHAETGDPVEALRAAVNARATGEAVAAGVAPVSAGALRAALTRGGRRNP